MDKQTWVNHIKELSGLTPPSKGGSRELWQSFLKGHCNDCITCKARIQTRKASSRAKSIRQVYSDLGLVRVKGALGGVYYE